MSEQDLIQIIPVINVDSGSPLSTPVVERDPYFINLDNIRNNKSNKDDDHKSESSHKSSLLETPHKIIEKFTGSLTALGKSIRNSLGSREEEDKSELEFIEKSSFEYDIDVMGTSSCSRFVATWSSGSGMLTVFPVDDQLGPRRAIFWIKTPFNNKTVTPEHKIYISVSGDGQYVAISRMVILKESHTDTPNMDDANVDSIDQTPESSFVVYSTGDSKRPDHSTLYSMEIL